MKTRITVRISEKSAIQFASMMIQASKWFECTPLPYDCWEFVTKKEPAEGIPEDVYANEVR